MIAGGSRVYFEEVDWCEPINTKEVFGRLTVTNPKVAYLSRPVKPKVYNPLLVQGYIKKQLRHTCSFDFKGIRQ